MEWDWGHYFGAVSGYESQKLVGGVPFTYHFGGDFDSGEKRRPEDPTSWYGGFGWNFEHHLV